MNGYPEMLRWDELPMMKNIPTQRIADLCGRCLAGCHRPGRVCLNVVADAPLDHVCKCSVCDPPEVEV
jgi:hypothetical protein